VPKVKVVWDTFLKKQAIGSQDLANSEKIFVPKDHEFYVNKYAPDRHQHLRMELSSPFTAVDGQTQLQNIYAYGPHVEVEGADAHKIIKLDVKYSSQLDNDTAIFGSGSRQCNTTTHSMLADYLLKGELSQQAQAQGFREPESVYMRVVGKYGDTTDHGAQTKALAELGIESYFSYSLSAKDLLQSLENNVPVGVGFAYKSSGHICLIVGHDPDKQQWLVHDPYGTRHGASNSYDIGVGGAYDPYSYHVMEQIYWDMGREAGWGRIVTVLKEWRQDYRQGCKPRVVKIL
jgi:hypothetical protein